MSIQWRIYCTEPGDEGFQYVWSDTAPTTCPNNVSHSVNSNSVTTVQVAKELTRVNHTQDVDTSNYFQVQHFIYNPIINGNIISIKMLAYLEGNATSFDIQVFDITNNQEIALFNSTNSDSNQILTIDTISNLPSGEAQLEIDVRRNGGNKRSYVRIKNIVIYTDSV